MMMMDNFSNVVKVVVDNLMLMFWLSMKRFVKKFSSRKEKFSILQLKDKYRIKVGSKNHLNQSINLTKLRNLLKRRRVKFQSGNFKVHN